MAINGPNRLALAAGFSALVVALSGCAATSPIPESSVARNRPSSPKTSSTVSHSSDITRANASTGTDRNTVSAGPSAADLETESRRQALIQSVDSWMGTPYRFGGSDRSGVDCSAFVRSVFREALDLRLPRTTGEQRRAGTVIDGSDIGFGDLVFFRISRSQGHVGVVIGDGQFAHASSSSGVTVSSLDDPYWRTRFDRAVRFDPRIADAQKTPVPAIPRSTTNAYPTVDSRQPQSAPQPQPQSTQPQRRGW